MCCRVRRNWEAQRALRLTKIEQPIVGLLRRICLLNYFKERKALDIPIKNESWYKSEGRKYKVQGSLLSLKLYKTGKFHNIFLQNLDELSKILKIYDFPLPMASISTKLYKMGLFQKNLK